MKRCSPLISLVCAVCLLNACGGGSSSAPVKSPQPQPLVIRSSAPPSGMTGIAYGGSNNGFKLNAAGGVAPYEWRWTAAAGSSLPPGLSISTNADSTGTIAGTPTAVGSYSVIIKVTDSDSPAVHPVMR